jgi:hypothetical protein
MWKGSALGGRSNASPFRFDKFDPIRLCSRLLDDSLSHGGKCLAEQELKGFSVLVSTPGLAPRHNWPLRRDLGKLHRLYGSNFRGSLHQNTPIILLFDPLIAHSNYMVTGFKNLVSYR